MPKAFDKSPKITFPPGCKELNEELSKDELVRRLKLLARAFQEMGQDENNEYKQLALYLATEFFLDHSNKDIRLLVACCIADIFRIFAPEAPYTEPEQLKEIFMFLTQQLRGLGDPEAPSFKRYFYLLENLAWVKSFNICIELEDNQEVFCSLYKLMFSIVNEKHSNKVVNFMLDMMCPLIAEADSVSQELLDIIMANIIEPYKSQNKCAYNLAKDLLRRTSNAIEPYIQTFFNNALMLGKSSESEVSGRLYELIYELNTIAPNVLLAVLPQLEFKLKSSDSTERKTVTRMLSRMFSEPGSDLAIQNKPLWLCFVGRFNDIDVDVRRICVQACQEFIVNHPELLKDIIEPLKQRQHDPDESVRMDVVQAVIAAAKREFANISPELLDCVKERILDKKYKIRKEALMGLGLVYKRLMLKEEPTEPEKGIISWIRNKILHAYYRTSLEDRILVERLLNTSLVPYSLEADDRMRRLYILYGSVDDYAVKALQELFKTQCSLRSVLKNLLELHQKEPTDEVRQLELSRAIQLARQLPESQKAQEYMKKFNKILADDPRVRNILIRLVNPDCSCKKAEDYVKEVLKKMGNPIPQNHLYTHVKMLLERVAPVMIDGQAVLALMNIIYDSIRGLDEIGDDISNASEKGLKLLLLIANMYPGCCQSEEIFSQLITFVKHDDDVVSDLTLQVFVPIGIRLEAQFPHIYSSLLPILQKFVKIGTPKQAKDAIRCIDRMCRNKQVIFSQIFEHLQKNMDLDSPNFLTSLVGIGHMAQLCPGEFATPVKGIVSKFIVKDLLMQDRSEFQPTTESWCDDHLVSEETQAKIQALKMVIRWLLGIKSNANNSASSTLRLLYTLLLHDGDLMERGKINKAEMSRLRLQAGCCMLKLAQEPVYSELVTLEQFQTLALLLNDSSYQVRVRFARKLHSGLMTLKLPLQYLSIFSLAANDPVKERRLQCKNMLISNITKRREFLKQHPAAMSKLVAIFPEYVMPFTVHLLAHDPDLVSYTDVETLKNIRECLWFMMEPLIKSENYSFSFYKKMLETIKQTKDAQQPDSEEANYKLYAVCDLAINLVLTKTGNLVLKDFPAEPILPKKLFTAPDQNFPNQKIYLPPELMISSQKGKKVLMVPPMNKIVVTEKLNGSNSAPSEKTSPEPYTASSNSSLTSSPKEPSPSVKKTGRGFKAKEQPPVQEEEDVQEEEEVEEEEEAAVEEDVESETVVVPTTKGRGRRPTKKPVPEQRRGRGRPKGSVKKQNTDDRQSPGGEEGTEKKRNANRPSKYSTTPATASQGRKIQGKITDFITKNSGAGKPSISASPSRNTRISTRGSPRSPSSSKSPQPSGKENANKQKTKLETRQTRTSLLAQKATHSPSTRSTRKREASIEKSNLASKRSRADESRLSRNTRSLEPDSRSSPKKSHSAKSPSPPPKAAKKRRTASLMNGTSDGEESAVDSQRSTGSGAGGTKTRATALARAIEEQGDTELNIKRKRRMKKR